MILSLYYYTEITIGFDRISYTFHEDRLIPEVRDEVFIIKQNNQSSELTYDIRIETFFNDADIIIAPLIFEEFSPIFQSISVNFTILPDFEPENEEIFFIVLHNNNPNTTFTDDPPIAPISILDTDSECCITLAMHGLYGWPECM